MARKISSHRATTRQVAKLNALVASLKAGALTAARRLRRSRRAKPAAASRSVSAASPIRRSHKPSPPPPPVTRTSIVRKPPRGPSVRSTRRVERRRSPRAAARPSRPPVRVESSTVLPRGASSVTATTGSGGAVGTPLTHGERGGIAPEHVARPEQSFSIPTGYGDDRIVVMVKDPWWIFAYWEIQPSTERAARRQLLPHEVAGLQSILRVYDVTGIDYPVQPAHASFDISLSGLAMNWYIQTNAPNRSFIVEIGLLTTRGRFLLLARSNRVTTPRFGPSDVIDEAWMISDDEFWKLFGNLVGVGSGSSAGGWSRFVAQSLSSGGRSSGNVFAQSRTPAVRGFWCRVDTDLIVHGATEPKATVTIQGQPVTLRKDGTFSLRVALPEGAQSITIECTSPDGRQTRMVTPLVTLAWSGSAVGGAGTSATHARQSSQPSGLHGAA